MFKFLTKNYTRVPLLDISFNLRKYEKYGAKNSCTLSVHPNLRDDESIKSMLNEVVDYIRDNYDMDKLSK